jgi:FkbM family methyltransferase
VDLVVDVGANIGQYGRLLRDWGYDGRILSFEPMRDEYAVLSRVADADGWWETVRSADDGELAIHVTGNSLSRLSPGLTDGRTGETLQVDGIFVRARD